METFGADETVPLPPTPAPATPVPAKKRAERQAEIKEATKRVEKEMRTVTSQTVEERKLRLLTRLERSETLEVAAEVAGDKAPVEITAVLAETENLRAAAETLAALWRVKSERAAETLMGLGVPRGAELLRIMALDLNDVEAAAGLVGLEEPGRVVNEAQFILPYSTRSVQYKGKELLTLISKVSVRASKAIYAALETQEQVSILRRSALGLGQRPGSEKLDDSQTTRLLERDFGTEDQPELAALFLSGLAGDTKRAVEVLHRFKTRGVKKGSDKWQRRQEAAESVQAELAKLDAAFAAEVVDKLAKKK